MSKMKTLLKTHMQTSENSMTYDTGAKDLDNNSFFLTTKVLQFQLFWLEGDDILECIKTVPIESYCS